MKRVALLLISICLWVVVYGQNYPTVERNGRQYYVYTVQRGDGLYSIAKKFSVKQSDLYAANEGLTENLKEGQKMYIPTKYKVNKSQDAKTQHVVVQGETPSMIAKMYNIALDSLLRNNPQIRRGMIYPGDTLVISRAQNIEKKAGTAVRTVLEENAVAPETIVVAKGETLYSISKKYNIAIHDIIDLNPSVEEGLKAGMTLRLKKEEPKKEEVPAVAAVETKEPENQQAAAKEEEKEDEPAVMVVADKNAMKIAYILPLSKGGKAESMFVEFYRGALLALDRARIDNAIEKDIEIWTYDTKGEQSVLDSILRLEELKKVDVIVGPGYTNELEPVLRFAKANKKMIIVPFSSKIERSWYFDKLYQFNPAQDWWWERALRKELSANVDKVIIGYCGRNDKGMSFGNTTANMLRQKGIPYVNVEMSAGNVDSIVRAEAKGNTVLLLASNSGPEVRGILDKMAENPMSNVTVWGFGRWGNSIIKKYNRTVYGSLFYYAEDEAYENLYQTLYNFKATGIDVRYDLLGYDITTFVVNKDGKYLQSEIDFKAIDGRWLNTRIYRVFWNGTKFVVE